MLTAFIAALPGTFQGNRWTRERDFRAQALVDASAWVAVQQPFWQVLHVANNRRARYGGDHGRHSGKIPAYVLRGLSRPSDKAAPVALPT